MTFERFQASTYDATYDYRFGSPHLTHPALMDRLFGLVRSALKDSVEMGLPTDVLEIGAGDGAYTEAVLAAGFSVTATEVSSASIKRLQERYANNPKFEAVHDPSGGLRGLDDRRYALILCVSVLHHVPDYVSFIQNAIEKHLLPGGTFLALQDPLWYPSVGRFTKFFTKFAYYSWRLNKGNYLQGLQTVLRRVRGVFDDEMVGDVVEYHVVRKGVNHMELESALSSTFAAIEIAPYWSSQSRWAQWWGDRLRLSNTFAIHAEGFRQPRE